MSLSTETDALAQTLQQTAAREDRKGGVPTLSLGALRQSGLLAAAAPADRTASSGTLSRSLRSVRELAEADGSIAEIFGNHLAAAILRTLTGLGAADPTQLLALSPIVANGAPAARRNGVDFVLNGEITGFAGSGVADRLLLPFRDALGDTFLADLPAEVAGLRRGAPVDTAGQRQIAAVPLAFEEVVIAAGSWAPLTANDAALLPVLFAAVRAHLLAGIASGAIGEGRRYTVSKSRPWIYSGYEKHTDDPFVQRKYGDLYIRSLAAAELADKATRQLAADLSSGTVPSPDLVAALTVAEVWASETALAAGAGIFEVMGARSATKENGYDRFWRNARTISLDHPPQPKHSEIGEWFVASADSKERIRHGQT